MQVKKDARPFEPEITAAFWINRASRLILRLHESRLRPLGFSMSQLPVLLALADGGEKSQSDLAREARVEQPTMAEQLARMERDGIVQRQPNPEDRRGSLTSLTRAALGRLPQARAALLQGEDDATAGFSKKEKEVLLQLLQRVVKNIEAMERG
jgi:DNA-binding MarR family transcriptional regulator